jgi:hypothetical protein
MRIYLGFLVAFALAACVAPAKEAERAQAQWGDGYQDDAFITIAAGQTNDLDVGGVQALPSFIHIMPNSSGSTLTGMTTLPSIGNPMLPGQAVVVRNESATAILTLAHNRDSVDDHRFFCPGNVDYQLLPGRSVVAIYSHDSTSTVWYGWQLAVPTDGVSSVINTVPSRTLNTAWQNTGLRPVSMHYSVRIQSGLTLVTGAAGRAELGIGASSGATTTICGRVAGGSTGTLGVGVNIADLAEAEMSCILMPGQWAKITTTNEVGTPTYSITAQLEQTF